MSKKNLLRILGMAVGTALCLCACSPEEYGPCSIPDTSAHRAACKPADGAKTATCTAEYVFDCDSLICGKFENSPAFCTYRCNPEPEFCNAPKPAGDSDFTKSSNWYSEKCKWPANVNAKDKCPDDAVCVEWTPGTGAYYCLPKEKGCSANYTGYDSSDPVCGRSSSTTTTTSSSSEGSEGE